MAKVPVDHAAVDACRAAAAEIADDVQRFIDRHTTVGVERTVARAYGVDGADAEGTPLVNALVDRLHAGGPHRARRRVLPRARAARGRELGAGGGRAARLRRRRARSATGGPTAARARAPRSRAHTDEALARIDARARRARGDQGAATRSAEHAAQVRHRRDRQHLRRRRAGQGRARSPAPTSSPSSARRRSRSSTTCPRAPTTEGYGGTFATQENFRIIRRALDEASARVRPLHARRRTTRRASA